jgi:lipopolysaccharide exporter
MDALTTPLPVAPDFGLDEVDVNGTDLKTVEPRFDAFAQSRSRFYSGRHGSRRRSQADLDLTATSDDPATPSDAKGANVPVGTDEFRNTADITDVSDVERRIRVDDVASGGRVDDVASGGRVDDVDGVRLEKKVRAGAGWSVLNTIVMRFANIAITAIVVRLVTPSQFGVFAAAITVYTVVSSLADAGVSACMVRGDLDPEEIGPTVSFISIFMGILLAIAMYLSASPVSGLFAAPQAVNPIRVLSLCLIISGVFGVPAAILKREFRQGALFLSTVIGFVPSNLVLILLASQGGGAMAFAWSRVVGIFFGGLVAAISVGKMYWPWLDRRYLKTALVFGLPMAGANLVNFTLLNADYALVGHQLGPEKLGVYLLAFTVASWPTSVLSSSVDSVAMPAFSRVQDDAARLSAALQRISRAAFLIAFPIATLSSVLAGPLINTIYGHTWRSAIPTLSILSACGAMLIVHSLLSNLLTGLGYSGRVFAIEIVWIVTLVPSMIVGVHLDGIDGVAFAHVIVLVLIVLPLYLYAAKGRVEHGLRHLAASAGAPLAACAVAGAAAFATSRLVSNPIVSLLIGGTVGGTIYLVLSASMFASYLNPARLGPIGPVLIRFNDGWARLAQRVFGSRPVVQTSERE